MTRARDRKKRENHQQRAEKQRFVFYPKRSVFSQAGSDKTNHEQQNQNHAHQLRHPRRVCGDGSNNQERESQ